MILKETQIRFPFFIYLSEMFLTETICTCLCNICDRIILY